MMIDLRQKRLAMRLTQQEMAVRADLSIATIAAIERGDNTTPSGRTRRKLAEAYEVSVDEIDAICAAAAEPVSA